MSAEERFYIVSTPATKESNEQPIQHARFIMNIGTGIIRSTEQKLPTYSPTEMVAKLRQALLETASHRPSQARRQWEDKLLKLIDAYAYWHMMLQLNFLSLPITVTPEGEYVGHALCQATKDIEVIEDALEL